MNSLASIWLLMPAELTSGYVTIVMREDSAVMAELLPLWTQFISPGRTKSQASHFSIASIQG